MPEVINLRDKLSQFSEQWTPKVVAALNGNLFKLAKLEGDFVWHHHEDTDELFLVIQGEFEMQLRDRNVRVREGEMIVIPKGVEHRPRAEHECHVLLAELAGTVNTGEAGGELTAPVDQWI
ncbi:MAG TPA: cupin [Planctomycetaceae bacterium]|nr:cupin [Planctomycetaceae bacterium]